MKYLKGSKNRNTVTIKCWNLCREAENPCFPYEFSSERHFLLLELIFGARKFFSSLVLAGRCIRQYPLAG